MRKVLLHLESRRLSTFIGLGLGLDRGGQDIDFELYAIKTETKPAIGRTYVWDIPVKILDFFALSLVLFRPLDCRPLQ